MPRPIRAAYGIPWGAHYGAPRAAGKRIHLASDYHAPVGTPIYGTGAGGRVTSKLNDKTGLGFYVTITYPNGRTLDAHMREASPLAIGAAVNAATIVGYVGLTGNAAIADPPGPHDHHERWDAAGARLDPEAFYRLEPSPTPEERDTTMHQARHPNGGITLIGETTYQHLTPHQHANNLAAYGPYVQYTAEGYQQQLIDVEYRRQALVAAIAGKSAAPLDLDAIAEKVRVNVAADFARLAEQIAQINTEFGAPTAEQLVQAIGVKLAAPAA